jgi:enoyl-CoA hydratase
LHLKKCQTRQWFEDCVLKQRDSIRMQTPEIIIDQQGSAGLIHLNRPKALNALTLDMVHVMAEALDKWEHDDTVTRIIVDAEGEKAFCAGGDIRSIIELGKQGRKDIAVGFWADEYRLNTRIKTYPKPYLSLIDGIVMGGGVGISLHGSHRIAGDRWSFAMPEVGIGLFPDVGGSYALSRLPGETGMWIALTGSRINRDDALALGIATHAVASADMAALKARLIDGDTIDSALQSLGAVAGTAPVNAHRDVIDRCFAGQSVEEILGRLDSEADQSDFAKQCAVTIRTKSPTSLAITFRQLRLGAQLTFREAMKMEFRIVSRVLDGVDFYEGVRAAVIDKDQSPRWTPASLSEITESQIDAYFAPLHHELELPR